MLLELGYGLGLDGTFVTGFLHLGLHVGEKLFVRGETGLDHRKIPADFGALVSVLAIAHIIKESLLGIDGVETGVDVPHQEHKRVVEGCGFLILRSEVCDLYRVLVKFLLISGACRKNKSDGSYD